MNIDNNNLYQNYKGYIIKPNTLELINGKWNLEISIEKYFGSGFTVKQYNAANQFNSYEEAIEACIKFGKEIIDGKINGLEPPEKDI